MMNVKFLGRMVSGLLAIVMAFCLAPTIDVKAEDQIPVDLTYFYVGGEIGTQSTYLRKYVDSELPRLNPVEISASVSPGDSLKIDIPEEVNNWIDKDAGFRCMLSEIYIYGYDADGRYQSVAIGTYDDFTQPFTVQIPDAD